MALVDLQHFALSIVGSNSFDQSVEARASQCLSAAKGFVENHIGYPLEGTHVAILDGEGFDYLWLPRIPVISITSIKWYDEVELTWTTYDTTDSPYRVNKDTGEVHIFNDKFYSGFQNIEVTYTHGFINGTVEDFRAPSIRMAVYEIATLFYNNPGLLAFSAVDDGVSRTRYNIDPGVGMMISPEVANILSSLSKRSAAR